MLEFHKIITVKKLFLLLGFFGLYFLSVIKPYVMMYGGSWHMEADFAEDIIRQYGKELLPDEFTLLQAQRPVYEAGETDAFIAQTPEYAAMQIHSLKELLQETEEGNITLEESNRLWFRLYEQVPQEVVYADMERLILFDIWDLYLDSYDREAIQGNNKYENVSPMAERRVTERNQGEVYSPCPRNVAEYNFVLLRYFAVFMMLGTCFFVMPYMVSENRSRMPALQCSFKCGRSYYRNRLAAMVTAVLCVAAVVCILYACCAKQDRVFTFWNCALSGFASGFIGWFPWTLGSYTLYVLFLALLASLGLSLLVFVATCHLSNHVNAVAWQIPAAICSLVYGGLLLFKAGEIDKPMLAAPAAGIGIFAAGIVAALLQGKWEKRKDVV